MLLLHKLFYRSYRFATGVEHWFRRRFTTAGIAVAAGLLVSMILGSDVTQTMAFQVFTLLAALLLVALLASLRFRGRFEIERSLPRLGTAGVPLRYRISIRNRTDRPQAGLELIEELADPRPTQAEFIAAEIATRNPPRADLLVRTRWLTISKRSPARTRRIVDKVSACAIPPLRAGSAAGVMVEMLPLRRGVLRFHGVVVARCDPFGLFRSFLRVRLPQTVLILPTRYPLPPQVLPGARRYQPGGVALAGSVGRSEEFMSLRDYRHGDPVRHIHWRSWAKTGRAIVKEFQDEFFVRHALVLDTFTDPTRADNFEEAVSVAASFACTVLTQESLLDLMFVGVQAYCFTVGRGVAHLDQMLEILAAVQLCPEAKFEMLSQKVLDHAASLSGCICVLLAWDEPRRKFVEQLRALGLPLRVVVITDAGEAGQLDPGPLRDEPESLLALETSRVAEGLARL
ncbi:MAG: DUF58 domain-containing protein [Verrucomicrobia bacterium]|nr:DUF58 domain-containing protein [Verrucomicrobiota bacterium]